MGQRANYIIKEGNTLTIHYNHWRATRILADLYLGEKRFLQFVNDCQLNEELIPEPWIEGCVIIDKPLRQLYFWAQEFPIETSVINLYISELSKKWEGWSVHMLINRMYDAEKILNIEYVSKQEMLPPTGMSKEDIIDDKIYEWTTAVVVIKDENTLFIIKTGDISTEAIIAYGHKIIQLLRQKPRFELPNEADSVTSDCVVIDTFHKRLFINKSEFGLWEQCKALWEGYDFRMGDIGYLRTLQLADIDTSGITMPHAEVVKQFRHMVRPSTNFDPVEMAKYLTKESKDVRFNPGFFDNVHPKRTILEMVKLRVRKLFKR